MAEDEKKKTGAQEAQSEQQQQAQEQPEWKKNVEAQRQQAQKLREYANSEVKIDTEGQIRPYDEFLKNKELQRLQESDEHKAAREKRERTTRRLAAIADGLVALSNVTGAMFGATPLKQTQENTLSAAQHKRVKEAAEWRQKNGKQYEIARNNALKLQQQQDKENTKRYDNEVKARQKAEKEALSIEQRIAKQEQTQANADRNYELAQKRYELSQEREKRMANKSTGGKSSGSRKTSKGESDDAYRYWMSLTEEEKKQWRDFNNRGKEDIADYPDMDANGNPKTDKDGNLVFSSTKTYPKDDKAFIELVWKERNGQLKNHPQGGSSSASGSSAKQATTGKKEEKRGSMLKHRNSNKGSFLHNR